MHWHRPWFLALAVLLLPALAITAQEKDTIRKTLNFPAGSTERWLEVDNINGSISVAGYEGSEVQLVVHRTISARTPGKIEEAKQAIVLDIYDRPNTLVLFVNAPYRRPDGRIDYRGERHYGYEVQMDFELRVPFDTNVLLKTVNDGDIEVQQVRGHYEVNNINGHIMMTGLVGSGKVYALNGRVKVDFASNPQQDCYFGSLNGHVEVAFRDKLSADLLFKTFNGAAYTDFDFTSLPLNTIGTESKRGKKVYSSKSKYGVRVANGGPTLEFDAFNGNIYIVNKDQ